MLALVLQLSAQEKEVKFQHSDIEFAIGGSFLPNSIYETYLSYLDQHYHTVKYNQSGGLYWRMEYRYNLKNAPFSVGLQIAESYIYTKYNNNHASNEIFNFSLVGDYNFKRQGKTTPYIGTTLGCVSGDGNARSYIAPSFRAGIKMHRHLNIGLEYKFYFKEDAHAVAYVGFFF